MDRCICCGRELDYEGTLVCWYAGMLVLQYMPHELIGHYFAEVT